MIVSAFDNCMNYLRAEFRTHRGRMKRSTFHKLCDERGVLPHEAIIYFEAMGMRVERATVDPRRPNQGGSVRPHLCDTLIVPIYEPEIPRDAAYGK